MKQTIYKIFALSGLILLSTSCDVLEVDRVVDPNSPSTAGVLNNASAGELQDLVAGLESVHRNYNNGAGDWWSMTGTFSRELFYINTSDPSFSRDWLQQADRSVNAEDNSIFFADASGYESPYGAIRQANLLLEAVENSENVNANQKNGYYGFANTIKAYQFQIPLMHQYQNGIRVDVSFSEPLNPGPFLTYDNALTEIRGILNEGATQLGNAGSSFNFELTEGFSGYDTPATLLEVNRAIAARFALYAEDWGGALTALDGSFLNLDPAQGEEGLMAGPAHTFAGGNDQFNPYYFQTDADENLLIVPHPDMITDAEAGDGRLDKFEQRTNPAETSYIPGLSADYQIGAYESATTNMPFIRNEELILIYAEAKAQRNQGTDLADAVDAINIIRSTWGLPDFVSTNQADIIDQVLEERKYSLWGEGHRWVDMRRYDRLDEIDTTIGGGRVPTQVARPQGELDWEDFASNN